MNKRSEFEIFVIDDDPVSNMLTEESILELYHPDRVHIHTNPIIGIEEIKVKLKQEAHTSIILLLDINMPYMSGWDVLDVLIAALKDENNNLLRIFMLSSSVAIADKIRAATNPYVSGYLEKPLTIKDLTDLIFKTNFVWGGDALENFKNSI